MSYVVNFHPDLSAEIDRHVETSAEVWREAKADYDRVRIAPGNYAGYGAYLARCHQSGVIEFPIGNRSSLLTTDEQRRLILADGVAPQRFHGTLLHEIGHHVVNTARRRPWDGVRDVGQSTHLSGDWIWICCTAWNHFLGTSLDPHQVAGRIGDNRDEWVDALSHFSPFVPPPSLNPQSACQQCGEPLASRRSTAKYCSARCRVAANRSSKC